MSDVRSDVPGMLLAFLAGAVVGVGVGMLLAPQSGKQTRKSLADLAKRAREAAEETAASIRPGYAPGSRVGAERGDA